MVNKTSIKHPIIESYVKNFVTEYEISEKDAIDQHKIFEQYINNLILSLYGNDVNASYTDMDTGTAFGIDGLAVFLSDKMVQNVEDVDLILEDVKRFDVNFIFISSKTVHDFKRQDIADFLLAVKRFFDFTKCGIEELRSQWDMVKYIYSKSSKFKKLPNLKLFYVTLSPNELNMSDTHMKDTICINIDELNKLSIFQDIDNPKFLYIKSIMTVHKKVYSDREVSINMHKQPIPYPKDTNSKIESAYYGLIKMKEFIKLLTDDAEGTKILKKGIFDDNIRYYLGSDEKIEVNNGMKNQLIGADSCLFGLLNNGITVICDKININAEEVNLSNYQIVNGCQTSNIIFECLDEIKENNDIYLPIRLISTEDEDTKNAIVKATNSQTQLKAEQLMALSSVHKAIEEYYQIKINKNKCSIYYERRTEQYRDDNIPKTKRVTIPIQIKSTSALFFDLPHAVSGQYGKVEKETRGLLFSENDLSFLNTYYVSGLLWYNVEKFVRNNDDGKKYKRARWHIIMLIKYILCSDIENKINKKSEENSKVIEEVLNDDRQCERVLRETIDIMNGFFSSKGELEKILSDRKLFERKETTTQLIEYAKKHRKSVKT